MIDYTKPIVDENSEPLKIGVLAKHHCIRCYRNAESLVNKGYTVYGNGNRESYGNEIYKTYFVWKNKKQFQESVKMMIDAGVRIIEWNNEPDAPAVWAREVINSMGMKDKVKLVSNLHDLDLIRKGFITVDERKMFNVSDALVYVSKPIQKLTNEMHTVSIPNIVLYNYPTQSMMDSVEIDWENAENRRGIVYEGGVNPLGNEPYMIEMNNVFKYRNLFPLFVQLISQGNEIHAFIGNADAYQTGQSTGVVLYPPTKFDKLLKELVKFKYNLIVFNNKEKTENQVNYTTANKQWDGLCAGLPSLTCYCNEIEKYTLKHNIGWRFDDLTDIGNCSHLTDYKEKLESVRQKRKELIFERQIWRVENLYAGLLGLERKGVPEDIRKQAVFEYSKKDTDLLLKE